MQRLAQDPNSPLLPFAIDILALAISITICISGNTMSTSISLIYCKDCLWLPSELIHIPGNTMSTSITGFLHCNHPYTLFIWLTNRGNAYDFESIECQILIQLYSHSPCLILHNVVGVKFEENKHTNILFKLITILNIPPFPCSCTYVLSSVLYCQYKFGRCLIKC